MGTRANIIRKNKDGSFDSIYTHWDGYPEHHAPILLEHYNTSARVAALLALGDLSQLGESLGEKHSFDSPPEGVCTAYGRDRNESGTESDHFDDAITLADILKEAWTEWVYVWVESEQNWYYTNNPSPTWFKCCGTEQLGMTELSKWEEHQKQPAARFEEAIQIRDNIRKSTNDTH